MLIKKKNVSGGNHQLGNKLKLIWPWGHYCQMPGLSIYLFIYFCLGGSSAVRSISVQSLLFSEVIKKSIDLSVSDSYLLPPPLVLCFVLPSGSPGREKFASRTLKELHFAAAQCTSAMTGRPQMQSQMCGLSVHFKEQLSLLTWCLTVVCKYL